MASYTSNLNLKKPALTDDALVTDLNDNSDKLDAAISAGSGAIAIVSVGNTHAAISSGQYVYVRQHGSLSEGLYKATTNIAANGTLSGSNLTAVSGGGLNSVYSALSDHIAKQSFVPTSANNAITINNYSCYRIADIAFFRIGITASSQVSAYQDLVNVGLDAVGLSTYETPNGAYHFYQDANAHIIRTLDTALPAGSYTLRDWFIVK